MIAVFAKARNLSRELEAFGITVTMSKQCVSVEWTGLKTTAKKLWMQIF